MPAFPYYPRYPQRFALATTTWSDEEVGAYCRLLDYQWDHGSVPSDEGRRNRIADSLPRTWPVISSKFEVGDDGELRNAFLEKIREKTKKTSERRSQSAHARWGTDANAYANALQSDSKRTANGDAGQMHPISQIPDPISQIPDPTSEGERSPRTPVSKRFERFWDAYPKRTGKRKAEEAFKRAIGRDLPEPEALAAIIATHASGKQWREGFVKNPATWLNQDCWLDEVEQASDAVGGFPSGGDRAPTATQQAETEAFFVGEFCKQLGMNGDRPASRADYEAAGRSYADDLATFERGEKLR